MASGDNLHLSGRGKELLHSMIDEGTESTTSAISAQHALDNRLPLPPLNIKQSANEEGVTAETLRLAESECKRPVRKAMDVLKRKNYLKVVDLAAQRIGVPAYAILAVHYKETNHMFNDRAKGDKGSANGMGQLWWKYHSNPKGSWDYAKENGNFRTTMAQFTDDNYDNIEGSQSILADTLATASFLKRAASKFDMDISYTSVLTKEQLIDLRWGYHKPTTAGKEKYKAQREKKSYPKYADLALEYKSALG